MLEAVWTDSYGWKHQIVSLVIQRDISILDCDPQNWYDWNDKQCGQHNAFQKKPDYWSKLHISTMNDCRQLNQHESSIHLFPLYYWLNTINKMGSTSKACQQSQENINKQADTSI